MCSPEAGVALARVSPPQMPPQAHVEPGHVEGLSAPGKGGTGGFRRPPRAANGSLLSSSLMPLLLAYCNYFH